MQIKAIPLLLAFALAPGLMASSLHEAVKSGYMEIEREATVDGGSLVYFGPESSINDTTLVKRIPSEGEHGYGEPPCPEFRRPLCGSSHTARNDMCEKLVKSLWESAEVKVDYQPRQICYFGAGVCCLSWADPIPSLTKADLAKQAVVLLGHCDSNAVDGKTFDVKVVQTCTDVCMSNRGNYC